MHRRRALAFACFAMSWASCWSLPAPASAQTLKDKLKQHVREGIDRSDEKAKEKAHKDDDRPKPKPKPKPHKPKPEVESHEQPHEHAADHAAEDAPATPAQAEPESSAPAPDTSPGAAASDASPAAAPNEPAAPASVPAQNPGADEAHPAGKTIQLDLSHGDPLAKSKDEKPPGPPLPVRVFGPSFKLDITLGLGYRGWYPQQYQAVDVDVGNYLTWNIDVKAKLFKFLNLRRGYYESNGIAGPRNEDAAVAAKIGSLAPKAVWLLGVLGVPISKAWEPQVRYESRAFETKAHPRKDVCVVDRKAPEDAIDCPGSMGDLKIVSSFETFVAGVRYDHSKSGSVVVEEKKSTKIPPIFFGVGLMQYRKPYQLTIDGYTLDDYLFDARFRGAGLALGTDLGGGLDNWFSGIDMQIGLGEASLTDKITLNELVPNGQLLGYVQGTAGLGYRLVLIHAAPTLVFVPEVHAGGATFFLVDTKSHKSTSDSAESTSPNVNWDFLWSVQASLLIPL